MTLHVTLAEAQGRLAELVARVRTGEEVLIDEDGRTVARLGPAPPADEGPWRPGRPIDLVRHPRGMGVLAHFGLVHDPDEALRPDLELDAAVVASRVFPNGSE